jgi:regulatory protein
MTDQDDEAFRLAKSIALKKLSRREHSAYELSQFLIKKGTSPELASQVIRRFQEIKLIDDERFAKIVASQQASRGKGINFVRQKLKSKGIHLESGVLQRLSQETSELNELERAGHLIARRFPKAHQDRKEASRALHFLVRRGFSFTTAREALKLAKDATDLNESDPEG